MKTIILLAVLSLAATKAARLNYRNLYKPSIRKIENKPGPKIIGGQEAKPHSIPYQAFLEVYGETYGWSCGGSLLSENYVLTAGHCGDGAVVAYITLGAHTPQQFEDTQVHLNSTEITVHEKFNIDWIVYDVSVMKLSSPVIFSDVIQPTVLPALADYYTTYENATARISGWGLTNGLNNELSDVLNFVDTKVMNNRKCEEIFGPIMPHIMCTSGEENTGACNGDSGGPVVVDGVQVGLVSFGLSSCPLGYPSAHSRLTRFLEWIGENTDVQIQ